MGRLTERLTGNLVLGLDTSVFIYHLEAHPRYLPLTHELLAGIQNGHWQGVTSVITIMEITVHPWQLGRPGVAREYEALLANYPGLLVSDVTRDIARRAAQLRAAYRLWPADALQAATAQVGGATAFVTNDRVLARLAPAMDVVLLEDLA